MMTSNKPYLIRAMYEWMCDNEFTPYVYVDTARQGVVLPTHLYGDEPLVLNISPSACQQLCIGNDELTFQARFSGSVFNVCCPISSLIAIIARENGEGLSFQLDEEEREEEEGNVDARTDDCDSDSSAKTTSGKKKSTSNSRSGLKLIK